MKTVLAALSAAVVAMLLMVVPAAFGGAAPAATTATAGLLGISNNCTRTCGNMSIPYPLGIEPGCYHAAGFNLTCNNSKLFLGDDGGAGVQVLHISVENSTVRINGPGVHFEHRRTPNNSAWEFGFPQRSGSGPLFLSESTSMLHVTGCNVQVSLRGGAYDYLVTSCAAICPSITPRTSTIGNDITCTGTSCCEASIVLVYSSYTIQTTWLPAGDDGSRPLPPISVYIVDQSYGFDVAMLQNRVPKPLPATLDWVISNSSCPETLAPECVSTHSNCQNSPSLGHKGYVCKCDDGYHGNPYVHGGCQDINECKSPLQYACYDVCKNTPGNFTCQCQTGYTGDPSVPNGCKDIDECKDQEAYPCYGICRNFQGSFQCQCPKGTYGNSSINGGCIKIKNSSIGLSIGLGVGGGTSLFLLALGGPYIMRKNKLRKVKKMKQKFFKQNHGLLLQQLISCNTDIGQRMIITLRDVEKATDNFNRVRVIGGGGHGVVFKGILGLQVGAIKKSKIVVQREIDDFINEVAVLSQANHRNVVKFLGCCLESEVPLLVYEFISNGTLYNHLHVEGQRSLSWEDRMRVASEVAKALSYLHSSASMLIFHRDVKSSNILLDNTLTAKVSNFGASRYIPIDQTRVITTIQGTFGYLDPMYYYTGRLTDKSDVFSFDIILVELVTQKKPNDYQSSDGNNLVSHFVSLLVEGKLDDIIDPQVLEEDKDREVQEVATLASMCTKLKGEDRPTMREVEMRLQKILFKRRQDANTQMSHNADNIMAHHMSTEQANNEAGRQYTMEEEMLLSASFPR